MLSKAKAKDGIKGLVQAIPAVGRHLMANLPKQKNDDAAWVSGDPASKS